MAATEEVFAARRQQAEERIVVLGELSRPPQYTTVGLLPDGRPIALSQNTPQLVLALGAQGTGKTHLSMLALDGIVCPTAGLGPAWYSDWDDPDGSRNNRGNTGGPGAAR